MIIPCIYCIHSDLGIFDSPAKIDLYTGNIFDIEISAEIKKEITTIHSETILFTYENSSYEFDIVSVTLNQYQIVDYDHIGFFQNLLLSKEE